MSALMIDPARCIGCSLCVRSCAFKALSMENKKAVVNPDVCALCGVCVDVCPEQAIERRGSGGGNSDTDTYRGVWVFVTQWESRPEHVALELLTKGRALADTLGEPLAAVFFGGTDSGCRLLLEHGADRVYFCGDPQLRHPDEMLYTPLLATLVRTYRPSILLFGATAFGRSLAPRAAARLGTGLTADCTQLEIDPETRLLRQTRPAFGGNLMATIACPNHRPQMATVRPGVLTVGPADPRGGEIIPVYLEENVKSPIELVSVTRSDTAGGLKDAHIIISAGRGIGAQKNMKLIFRLAELMGAQVGASRPLVEAGWVSYDHQIGQTGCNVSPKLLITFGISGAIQHLAGISGADCLVAVNNDPDAAIFGVADYGVVGDCQDILRKMIAQLEKEQAAAQ